MKVITESNDDVNVQVIEEATGPKSYFIEGIFLQGEVTNKNKRFYSNSVLESAVNKYTNE